MRAACTVQWHSGEQCVCCMHVHRHAYLWVMHVETRDGFCHEFSVALHFHLFILEQYLSVNPVLAALVRPAGQ